jgi:hypothetical protein
LHCVGAHKTLSSLKKIQINLAHLTAHRGVLDPSAVIDVSRSLPKGSKPENGVLEALFARPYAKKKDSQKMNMLYTP